MAENTTQISDSNPRYGKVWDLPGKIWSALTRPHDAIQEIGRRRQAQLLSGLSFLMTLAALSGITMGRAMNGSKETVSSQYALLILFVFMLVSYLFSRTRFYTVGTAIVLAAFSVLSCLGVLTGAPDPVGFALTFLPLAFMISSGLLSMRGILIFTAANVLFLVLLKAFPGVTWVYIGTVSGQVITYGVLLAIFAATRNAIERDRLAETTGANKKLEALSNFLEQRVADRTRDLLLAAEVGQRVSRMQNLDELLPQAVELIRERFNLYYVQVYLTNKAGNTLILRAGTGEAGKELLVRGHRLPIDHTSVNGTAAVDRKVVIIADTGHSLIHRSNALLPETCSEAAIPLVSGDRVLGVLDLQHSQPGVLIEENLPIFETLAGNLSTALANTELFEQLQESILELESRGRQVAHERWAAYQDAIHKKERIGFVYDQVDVKPLDESLIVTQDAAQDPCTVNTAIRVAGEPVGTFQFVLDHTCSPDDAAAVSSIAAQVSQQVEVLRALEQAERYRSEAEEAIRRLTRSEWAEYMQAAGAETIGFVYAEDQVLPLENDGEVSENSAGSAGAGSAAAELAGASSAPRKFDVKIRDEQIGAFELGPIENLSPDDQGLIEAVSEQLGAHLENIRLYANSQRELEERRKAERISTKRAAELTTVSEVATIVATIQRPEHMLQTVVDLTKASFGLYHAHIYLLNDAGDTLVLTRGAGEIGRLMVAGGRQIPLQAEKSLVARAARTRQGVMVNDVRLDPDFLPNPLLPSTRSEMAVPMIVGERLLGVLDIQSTEANHFSEEDIAIQTTLASQVAVALQNARQYTQTQESEKLIRTVIDSTPDWIFIKDQQYRYRLVNQGYANSLHIPVEDFIGKNDLELGFPEDFVKGSPEKGIRGFWADDRQVMDGGEPVLFPNDPSEFDGKVHIFNTLKTPLRDANGTVWGVLAFCRDVTEREQILSDMTASQEALRSSQAQLSEALEIAQMAYWESDYQSGTFTLNDQFYSVYQTTAEEQGGYTMSVDEFVRRFVLPEDAPIVGASIQKAIESTEPNFQDEHTQRYRRPDGSIGYITVRLRVIKDEQGRLLKAMGANQDVTEIKRAEEALAQRAAQLATVAEVATVVASIQSPEEMLQTVVDLARQVFRLYHVHIYLLNEPGDTLSLSKGSGEIGRKMVAEGRQIAYNAENSLVARAARTRQGVIVNDIRQEPEFLPHPLLPDTSSEMAVPMIVGDRLLGVIDVQDTRTGRFTPEDVNIMTTLAAQVAVSLQNARSYVQAHRQAEREALINAISERIQATNSVESALQVAVREISRALGAQHASVRLGLERRTDGA